MSKRWTSFRFGTAILALSLGLVGVACGQESQASLASQAATGGPRTRDAATSPSASDETSSFVIAPEMPFRAYLRNTGVFINAFHIPRPTEEMIERLRSHGDDKRVSVIICRGNQQEMMSAYRLVADLFIMESLFFKPSTASPADGELIWPEFDHPMINYLREIRHAGQGTRMIVAVPMTTREVWAAPRSRPESFEEFQWMTFAVIGANYQGILWGHERHEKWWARRLAEFEAALKRQVDGLAEARLVDWVSSPEGQPVSALASDGKLFVAVLNPNFMKVSPGGENIVLPLDNRRLEATVTITPPDGHEIVEGRTLDGGRLDLTGSERQVETTYRYRGGGTLLTFTVREGNSAASGPSR